jgi:hypothetical protein
MPAAAWQSGYRRPAEAEFVARGFADLLAAETSPWAGCKTAPPGQYGEGQQPGDGTSPSWFARFQQLSCRKALIYGELSLPAQEADDVVAVGIPLLVVPDAGHSMAWENPVAAGRLHGAIFRPRAGEHLDITVVKRLPVRVDGGDCGMHSAIACVGTALRSATGTLKTAVRAGWSAMLSSVVR